MFLIRFFIVNGTLSIWVRKAIVMICVCSSLAVKADLPQEGEHTDRSPEILRPLVDSPSLQRVFRSVKNAIRSVWDALSFDLPDGADQKVFSVDNRLLIDLMIEFNESYSLLPKGKQLSKKERGDIIYREFIKIDQIKKDILSPNPNKSNQALRDLLDGFCLNPIRIKEFRKYLREIVDKNSEYNEISLYHFIKSYADIYNPSRVHRLDQCWVDPNDGKKRK